MRNFANILAFLAKSHLLAAALVVLVLIPSDIRQTSDVEAPARVIWTKNDAVPEPMALEFDPITEVEAIAANAAIPFSTAPVEIAGGVNLLSASFGEASKQSALECMTAAIYHEAGFEPVQGRRAVAQVVLNRVKHPAFPNSVCDVVYQGSERRTGCQFTFTCDGSLARRPPLGAWEAAKTIAREALSGGVEPSVGMSTHYHANYVLPYWAHSLDKVVVVGSHIFYKWKGTYGRRVAFSQIPIAEQGMPDEAFGMIDFAMPDFGFDQPEAQVTAPPSPILADRFAGRPAPQVTAPTVLPPPIAADKSAGRILADEKAGTLLLDGETAQ